MQSKSRLTDFEIQTKLGSGSYGVIYRVVRRADRKVYVLKQVNLSNMKEKTRKNVPMQATQAINEATILSRLTSPFIVRYLQSFIDQNCLNIVMEYCEGGDLALLLKQQGNRPLKQDKIWRFFLQICYGLEYIHSKRILHRDIKTLNIFLTRDEIVKIGDLGVAKLLHENADFAQTMVGTPFYLSPELCEEKPYNQKSDIWALGCLLYEMCTYKHPFEAANQGSLILKIVRGRYNPISETYSKELRETVDLCLERDYKRRPTASVLLSRPALKQKCEQLGIRAMMEKHQAEESKRIFAMQLEKQLNKKEQASQPPPAQPPAAKVEKHKPSAGKIFEQVKNRKEEVKKDEAKEQLKRQQQLRKEKEEQQRREEQQKREEQRRREEQKKEQAKRQEQRKEQQRKEEQRKREKEEQMKKLEAQRREQAQQNFRRSEEKRKQELRRQEEQAILQAKEHESKPMVEKVRYQREVNARVFDAKRLPPAPASSKELKKEEKRIAPTPKLLSEVQTPTSTPARIVIKTKGFSNDDNSKQYSSNQHLSDFEPSSVKSTEKKHVSNSERKLIVHSSSNHHAQPSASEQQVKQDMLMKRCSEPKVLFGVGNPQPSQIPPLPPARVRKGAPIEKSRYSKNPIRPKGSVTEEEERLVANLPDESSSDEDNYASNRDIAFRDKKNNSGMKFQLKEVDDQEVLRRYEQLMEGRETQPSIHQATQPHFQAVEEQHEEETENYPEEDHELKEPQEDPVFEEQHHQDSLEEETVHYPDQQEDSHQKEQQQHHDAHQTEEEQILEEPAVFDANEWQFDEQPELPAFEEANMLLMEPEEEDTEQTRNYLQDKLAENMKRQDELNQLMQLKIDECRRAFKSTYEEVIEFLRRKLNMQSEYNEEDEREVEQFMRSKKLVDAKKFQNIYKILHFEMELENCRNIIQGICKKLAQLEK